jgi:hypothetical protein
MINDTAVIVSRRIVIDMLHSHVCLRSGHRVRPWASLVS